ncbi:DUF669 domain-containing protein [Companilactobacillus bobalius]|uniref:DUF669 domain-containing protein n=2 Tax=Companilactobacillus bobalius TaxID=2801451 RepID=A0A202F5Q7_9LACO|nr:DUF669 domain-containing protein [Companilactobacillus bobalius]KAE9560679.1 single-stranded DNA-binding protein [Companilactobacillus bobalius]KRK85022.1 single stranded binding protein [Companilactobacillus bobalius DSM 19674]OVE95809.1 hypothetical protein LKACC16343_02561 [Companilactobacillus bobalius]GEO59339.1 hypothetical protein LBO01_24680 [Companilactobacillus paralimentarius]
MSFIKTNYSKNQEKKYTPLPTGDYEMIIESAQERATKNGAESLQLKLVVRNDLDGASELQKKHHNRSVFMDNWKRKATNQYDMQGFQYILDACKIPEGTDIPDVQSFMDIISRKPVLVHVEKTTDTYNGKEREINQIAPWGISQTKFPDVQHKFKDPNPVNEKAPEVSDSDLPF